MFKWKANIDRDNTIIQRIVMLIPQSSFINSTHLLAQFQAIVKKYRLNLQ